MALPCPHTRPPVATLHPTKVCLHLTIGSSSVLSFWWATPWWLGVGEGLRILNHAFLCPGSGGGPWWPHTCPWGTPTLHHCPLQGGGGGGRGWGGLPLHPGAGVGLWELRQVRGKTMPCHAVKGLPHPPGPVVAALSEAQAHPQPPRPPPRVPPKALGQRVLGERGLVCPHFSLRPTSLTHKLLCSPD